MFEEKTSESPALTIRQKRRLFYQGFDLDDVALFSGGGEKVSTPL